MRNLLGFLRAIQRYRNLKGTENAATSKYFGVCVIFQAIFFVGISALIPVSLNILETNGLVATIFGLILIVAAGFSLLTLLIHMIVYLSFQFKLNRKAVSFIALVFFLLAIAGAIVVCLILLNK